MCEATVYVDRDGEREKVMEDVVRIESTEAGLVLTRLFDPPQTVESVIHEIDFLKHFVTLVTVGADQ